jgi:tetratricopeptide (TPR) repeat protein
MSNTCTKIFENDNDISLFMGHIGISSTKAMLSLNRASTRKRSTPRDEAIKLDPKYSSAWNNKGQVFGGQDKYEEAIKAFDEAIRLEPRYAAAWNNKGVALNRLGRIIEADAAFAKAKELGYKANSSSYQSV